jgi:hypothetical protein
MPTTVPGSALARRRWGVESPSGASGHGPRGRGLRPVADVAPAPQGNRKVMSLLG